MKAPLLETTSQPYRAVMLVVDNIQKQLAETDTAIAELAPQRGKGIDRDEYIKQIATGSKPESTDTVEQRYTALVRTRADLKAALPIAEQNAAKVRESERGKLLNALEPGYNKLESPFRAKLGELRDIVVEFAELRQSLNAQGLGHYPLMRVDSEIQEMFGHPADRASPINILLRLLSEAR